MVSGFCVLQTKNVSDWLALDYHIMLFRYHNNDKLAWTIILFKLLEERFLQSESTLNVRISGKPISSQKFLGVVFKLTCLVSYCHQPACGLSAPSSVSALYARTVIPTTAKG